MTIINVCNLFAPVVGPLIGIINILILILILYLSNFFFHFWVFLLILIFCFAVKGKRLISSLLLVLLCVNLTDFLTVVKFLHSIMFYINVIYMQIS